MNASNPDVFRRGFAVVRIGYGQKCCRLYVSQGSVASRCCEWMFCGQVMTLNPMCEMVETSQGVPLTVTGVAQCKIMKAVELLQTASEQFLGKSVKEIKSTVLQTLEGHLRAILGL